MENERELLTVKEFALAAGVTEQAIYKRLNNQNDKLNNHLIIVEGKKRLDKAALQLFTQPVEQPVEQPLNQVEQPSVEGLQQLIDTQAAEIESLQDQLKAKDHQISFLQDHADKQQQTIDNLTAALTAAQTLQAMEKQERLQLTDQGAGLDPTPGGDQSETQGETEGAPAPEPVKRKLWERIFKRK